MDKTTIDIRLERHMRKGPSGTGPARWRGPVAWLATTWLLASALGGPGAGAMELSEGSARLGAPGSTNPAASALPFRFAVLGDFGSGLPPQGVVARRMCRRRAVEPFRLVVTTGDNVYPAGERDAFRRTFLRPYACLRNHGVRFHSSLGNHDYVTRKGEPELNEGRFGMPARNYVFRANGVRFVMVNSNEPNLEWIRRATRTQAGDRWTIVAFHHPMFSPGTHGSSMTLRRQLKPTFERRGVDLVLNGHDHIYSASRPIEGIRYVVSGGGGASLYGCSRKWFVARCRARHHFLVVTARGDHLGVTAVPARGPSFHTFTTRGRR